MAEAAAPRTGGSPPRHRRAAILAAGFGLTLLLADQGLAQTVTLDLGDDGGQATSRIIQVIALLTVLSLAPSLLMMVTSFTRLVVVLSLLRTALGVPQTPPNAVLISLALFMTLFIMQPVLTQAWEQGVSPLVAGEIDEAEGLRRTAAPFHAFMRANVRERDVSLFLRLSETPPEQVPAPEALPWPVLIPAFMISELRRAFEIGFLLFLPFLIIDMLIASILMSMGMMMLPPATISLPVKLIFFVLIDGWYLIAGSLVQSYSAVLPAPG